MGLVKCNVDAAIFSDTLIIEMDCKQVVDDVFNHKFDASEYGSIVADCRAIYVFATILGLFLLGGKPI